MDEDGNDGIELEEFITHFGDVLAANSDAPLTRAELKQLFMKIDADGNGSVDWDEFTNYMFLMRAPAPEDEDDDVASQYLPLEFVEADDERPGTRHPDVITCVEYLIGLDAYATDRKTGVGGFGTRRISPRRRRRATATARRGSRRCATSPPRRDDMHAWR